MPMSFVEALLTEKIGLEPSSLGSGVIALAARERMACLGLESEPEYYRYAAAAPEEIEALIESIVVPETWFFRDREAFSYLKDHAARNKVRYCPARPLRALSIPCSSGEEPYSMAMTLREAGFAPEEYRIDAFDISREQLRKAEAGVYSERAFRGASEAHRERFFDGAEGDYRILPELRASIRFAWGNMMDPAFLAWETPYDVIFCRNVLIYQHAEARKRIVSLLDRLLPEDGLLFVGHAEVIPLLRETFAPVRSPGIFAFTRKPVAATVPRTAPIAVQRRRKTAAPALRPSPPLPMAPPSPRVPSGVETNVLDRARSLADRGDMAEAGALCEQALRERPDNAAAYFLLGLVHDAAGRAVEAEECLNRAIYLDAAHADALTHLSLMVARRGDAARAELLRLRAVKAHQRREVTG